MGWGFFDKISGGFARLGHKISGGVKHLGQKVADVAKTSYNWGYDHLADIGKVAGKVSSVSAMLSRGATMLAGGLATTGIGVPLAAGLTSFAGLAKGVSLGAKGVVAGTGALQLAKQQGLIKKWE